MKIPTSIEIENLQHGDIITTKVNRTNGLFLYCSQAGLINSGSVDFVILQFYCVGVDADNMTVGSLKSLAELNSIEDPPLFWIFNTTNFNDDYNFINRKLEKLSPSERIEFDAIRCRYIDKDWIFAIEKHQFKSYDVGGMNCCECNQPYDYAVPNLSNGKLACWSCRDSCKWKYSELYIGEK